MPEIQNSQALDELISHAKTIGGGSNPKFTAERFLLTVLEVLDGSYLPAAGNPFSEYEETVKRQYARPAVQQALRAYVDDCKQGFLDVMYIQQKLIEAKAAAAKEGEETLSPEHLLECILNDPSKAIKTCLEAQDSTAEAAKPETLNPGDIAAMLSGKKISVPTPKQAPQDAAEQAEPAEPAPEQPEQPAPEPPKTEKLDAAGISSLLGAKKDILSGLTGQKSAPQQQPEVVQEKLTLGELTQKVKNVRDTLKGIVFGQDHAVNLFAGGYFQGELLAMSDKERVRPRATFLFAGPPGVGKTLLAEEAAKALGLPFMRFDMSEYADKEANIEFAGADNVYKNAKEGNVTGFVAKNPRCVLLFDEIEKANLVVIHLFLQLLDAGRLRDNFTDQEVSFKDAIIFFTTNAGRSIYQENTTDNYAVLSRKVILRAIEKDTNPVTGGAFFPAAILSRFSSGNVVMFNHISAHNLRRIVKKELTRQTENFEAANNVKVRIDEQVYNALLFAEGGAADARAIRGRAESFFVSELFELLRLVSVEKVNSEVDDIREISIEVELPEQPEVRGLFTPADNPKALLFASDKTAALCREKAEGCDLLHVQTVEEAAGLLRKDSVDMILIDLSVGLTRGSDHLNIEDVESVSRDFYRYVMENYPSLPVHILETDDQSFSEEEKNTYLQQGVRGFLGISQGDDSFTKRLSALCVEMHQQNSMLTLARANRIVTFGTAQTVTDGGAHAHILLYDFRLKTAVDSEDQANVLSAVSRPDVKFDQVIGAEDAKKELKYFVEYLRNPKKYLGTGVTAPKGVLLYGPPGTGKTMLAKAMAAESDVTFIAAEGNQFLKKYVGEGPELVHSLFRTARKYAPAILFVDEIDTIARKRTGSEFTHASEEILTAFLAEMDGFKKDPSKPVFVLAATNYDVDESSDKGLDPAMMRRFDRRVFIDLPRREDRVTYIRMKLASNPAFHISENEIENLTVRSTGMSLAQLESVFELALRSTIREGSTEVTDAILEDAFETFNSGDEKKWDASTLERVARHEAGHTFLCWESGENPSYVTIVARGSHGGYMQHDDRENKPIATRDDLLARIRTSLGGRAAELVYYGVEDGISTGPSGDLEAATRTAQSMLCYYGMEKDFGLSVVDPRADSQTAPLVREAVNKLLDEQMEEAIRLIRENREAIDALVDALKQQDHLTGDEIDKVLSAHASRRN